MTGPDPRLLERLNAGTPPPAAPPRRLDQLAQFAPVLYDREVGFMFGPITRSMAPFVGRLAAGQQVTTLDQLPDEVKTRLEGVRSQVMAMGPGFDYERLSNLAEQNRDRMPVETYEQMAAVGLVGQMVKNRISRERGIAFGDVAVGSAMDAFSFGLIDTGYQEEIGKLSPGQAAAASVIGSLTGVATSGVMVFRALGLVTKLPRISTAFMRLAPRARDAILGTGTGAIMEAARPDGLPEEPSTLDITARLARPVADMLGGSEGAQRTAMGLVGGGFGAVIGEVLGGVARGVKAGRIAYAARNMTDEDLGRIRTALQQAGVELSPEASRGAHLSALIEQASKGMPVSEELAGTVMSQLSREDYIAQQLLDSGVAINMDESARSIQSAAIRLPNGRIYTGRMHADAVEIAQREGATAEVLAKSVDGYVTSDNRFISRQGFTRTAARAQPGDGVDDVHSYDIQTIDQAQAPARSTALPVATIDESMAYAAALFRANPGGMSIATGVSPDVPIAMINRLVGSGVMTVRRGHDVLIARPAISLPDQPITGVLTRQLEKFQEMMEGVSRNRTSPHLSILPNGKTVRGEVVPNEVISTFKLRVPEVSGVARPDLVAREHLRLVQVVSEDGGHVIFDLPSTLTRQQMTLVTRFAERGANKITLRGPGTNTAPVVIENPIAMQVEDAIAGLIPGASRGTVTKQMAARIEQFAKEGVFDGQAAVLADGYPVQVVKRYKVNLGRGKQEYRIQYVDPLTKTRYVVNEDQLSILPTSLEGELTPNTAFMQYLDEGERALFGKLRQGVNMSLARPITTFKQLDQFAAARGLLVEAEGAGRVRLFDPNTNETLVFENIKAATKAVRNRTGPLPDLTPPEMEELLGIGKLNLGGTGGVGGPPHMPGERVAIPDDMFEQALEAKTWTRPVPGALQQVLTPSRGLFLDLEKKYNLPFGRIFLNLQESLVKRQNFMAGWVDGAGGTDMPPNVMSLSRIRKIAGRDADGERITAWLEGSATDKARIAATMTPGELKAAKELRTWYDNLYDHFGIPRDYLESYAPRFRMGASKYGNDVKEIWRLTENGEVPKWLDFIADYSRFGGLDLYELNAFKAAQQYAAAGSYNRYLNLAFKDAAKLLKAVPDMAVKGPLANYIEAVRGTEFNLMKASLDSSFEQVFRSLGMAETAAKTAAERYSLALLGMSYSATMAFRPGLAIRNLMQIVQTSWVMFGGATDEFAEAIGHALTKEGYAAAVTDAAIAVRTGGYFAADDIVESLPPALRAMSDYGMKLYNTSDQFGRTVAYWTQRIRAERASSKFADRVASGVAPLKAREQLILESGVYNYDKPIVDEFLRRMGQSPEKAARWLGKQGSDVTLYLYGRGNQPRWMRTIPGRFLGQFGTWPLWYIDFVRRTTRNLVQNGYKGQAVKFLGRLAISNMAFVAAGTAVGIDLWRWTGANSIFYTGGPGAEVVSGLSSIMRGSSEIIGDPRSDIAEARINSGLSTLERVGVAFIPGSYGVRDMGRMWQAMNGMMQHPAQSTPTELVASILGTRPTREFSIGRQLDMLADPGVMSTDIEMEADGDTTPTAAQLLQYGMRVAGQQGLPRMPIPAPGLPGGQQAPVGGGAPAPLTAPQARPAGRPPMPPTSLPPSIRSGESNPVPY